MERVIDIHTHILYGIDDGSEDYEMSLKLLNMEYAQGVRDIFFTNHSYGMRYQYKNYYKRFDKLKEIMQTRYTDLNVYKGCEILCYKNEMASIVKNIKNNIYPTMNETNYILMEFDPYSVDGISEVEYCVQYAIDKGYIPIIAHAERYKRLYNNPLENIVKIKEFGCKLQINLYSIEQEKQNSSRKELANLFLDNKYIDFVGTDTHRLDYKSVEAFVGIQTIKKRYDNEYSNNILYKNGKMLNINF